ncbi:MAG TPA: CU044_2847 family protein [Waterburya sp.]|jgi:hypothetical protein
MSEIEHLIIQDGDEAIEVFVQSKTPSEQPIPQEPPAADDEYESYGAKDAVIVQIQEIHKKIRGYTKLALGAFKNFSEAEVEEVTIKFGIKLGGKTGIPFVTEGSAESNFEFEVKCKLPKTQSNPGNS